MKSLVNSTCHTNYQNSSPLTDNQIAQWLGELNEWKINRNNPKGVTQLIRTFVFKGYLPGVEFTQQVALMAEQQNHHPDILLSYGKVTITWWTHAVGGLHHNDFICAAKTEQLLTTADNN